ncbi:hypothetical protein SISSUDRAFT_1029966 [Sistotremastrum suecicum HHB10207 ss-3]|uniref:Uncharacterized protein n=1 Tax=Sistotremastrum suecicum HHB10207 ss-3 TaxID=1314776 RepID=A0A166HU04_9AGAM|nr:hypothetical protein SISSUDRAFT_1029966 [Sistotremastrum suecicum HHB10207 ss-3]
MKRARASDRENITTDDDPYQQDAPLPSHKRRKLSFDSTVQYRTIYNASSRDPRNQREPFSKAASVVPSPTKAPLSHRTLEPERSSSISRRRSSLSSKASRSVSRKPVSKGRDSLSSSSCEPKPEQQKITFTLPPAETPEAYAQKRIAHLIRREHRSRFADGLQRVISDAEDLDEIEHEETIFGLNPDLRKEVVHWILDLRDNLIDSPNTRFHACLLFCRYFVRVGDAMSSPNSEETAYMARVRDRLVWDIALGCLAIAVKPVGWKAFLLIAPCRIGRNDFEMCERDILNALDWQVWDVNPEALALDLFTALSLEQSLMAMDDDYIQLLFKDIEESLTAALSGKKEVMEPFLFSSGLGKANE